MLFENLSLTSSQSQALSLGKYNNIYFLHYLKLDTVKYCTISHNMHVIKQGNNLKIWCLKTDTNELLIKLFIKKVYTWLKNLETVYTKILLLKGLGYRIQLQETPLFYNITFKLGLSHLIQYSLSKLKLKIYHTQTTIILKSHNLHFLNNICKKIINMKKPNIYTGRGFWYKTDKIQLKTFKK